MKPNKKIVLFVNDSYFSFLLAKDLINTHHDDIGQIIFSKSTVGSRKKIISIYKKVSLSYFIYRVLIQFLSKSVYKKKSIKYLAKIYNIKNCEITNSSKLKEVLDQDCFTLGFAFNFDLIIRKNIITKIDHGIYNIHASKLPNDKGISPVLWAFARGDKKIWSSIYKIDEGIDSGPILKQFQINVNSNDTSYSIYKRVCIESGYMLNSLIKPIVNNEIVLTKQSSSSKSNYFSWPDNQFNTMMKKSNRKLIRFRDIFINVNN